MANEEFHTLRTIAKVVAFCGWLLVLSSVLMFFVALGRAPLFAFPGAIAGVTFGLIVVAQGQFFACIVKMSRDLDRPAETRRHGVTRAQFLTDTMNLTSSPRLPLLAVLALILAACGTPPGQVSITLTEPTGILQVAFGVSARSSVDLRAGNLRVNITAQGGVDECAYENPGPVFAADVNESLLQYNPGTEPGDVRGLFQACAFEMRHVEEVTARIGRKRLRCRLVDAPTTEDEAPEQDEAAQERRSVFDYRGPPPATQSYRCP